VEVEVDLAAVEVAVDLAAVEVAVDLAAVEAVGPVAAAVVGSENQAESPVASRLENLSARRLPKRRDRLKRKLSKGRCFQTLSLREWKAFTSKN
jgi:hypothetical protein